MPAVVPSVLLVVLSAALWFGARRLRLISGQNSDPTAGTSGISPAILQSIAFSVVGVFVLIEGVASIPNLVVGPRGMWYWSNLAAFLIRLTLGLWLLLGAEGLRKFRAYLLERLGPVFDRNW